MIFNQRNILINTYKISFLCILSSFILSNSNTNSSTLYFNSGCIDPNAQNCSENCFQCGGSDNCVDDGSCEFAPVLHEITNITFQEDSDSFTQLILSSTHPNNYAVEYFITGGSENTIISSLVNNFTVNFSSAPNYYGTEKFIVTASDGTYEDFQEFFVTVENVNDPPIINEETGLQAILDTEFQYTIEVDDSVDNDTSFIFSLSNNPFGVTMESYLELAIVSYTPTVDDLFVACQDNPVDECFTFTVKVEDGDGEDDEHTFYVEIVESENVLPSISLANALSDYNPEDEDSIAYEIDEDSNIQIDFTINDDDDFIESDLTI